MALGVALLSVGLGACSEGIPHTAELKSSCPPEGCSDGSDTGDGQGTETASDFDPSTSQNDGDDTCADVQVSFDAVIPTVVLLIDQSGSMTQPFGNTTRWDAVDDALFNTQTGAVASLDGKVSFGMTLYTSVTGGVTCPLMIQQSPMMGGYPALAATFAGNAPREDTPTGEALVATADALQALISDGPKAIILATDGEPDTCLAPDAEAGQSESIHAAQYAYNKGIQTYVISVGADISQAHLQELANAGVGLPAVGGQLAPYYQALNPQELVQDFDAILSEVRPCTFTLNGVVEPGMECEGTVTLDGQPIGCKSPNGWRLNGQSEIELVGVACDTLQKGDHELEVSFPCGAVTLK